MCQCDCGNKIVANANNIKRGITRSCGCFQKERASITRRKHNVFQTYGAISIGFTTSGTTFLIDTEDLDKVSKHYWYENDQGYIVSNIGNNTFIRLHRLILNVSDERIIDHKNRDKTDNRKTNLRIANKQQNSINRDAGRNSVTGVKGVSKSANGEKYTARICKDGRTIYIGTYNTLEEASQARNKKEFELFGEFAFQNNKGGGSI